MGEHYDENIPARHCSFVVTADNRFIVAAGFWDNSFRIFNADTGKIVQVSEEENGDGEEEEMVRNEEREK